MDRFTKLRYATFEEVEHYAHRHIITCAACPMCESPIRQFNDDAQQGGISYSQSYRVCSRCGWWAYGCTFADFAEGETWGAQDAIGNLFEFSVSDPTVPLDLLLKYLRREPLAVDDIHHRKFEELIAAIYREVYGYQVILTKPTHDKGIDLYVFDGAEGVAAVQVKHVDDQAKPIGIGVLQRLVGAAYPRGIDAVHLVTNGRISSHARAEAQLIAPHISVEMLDFRDIAAALDLLKTREYDDPLGGPGGCPLWRLSVTDMTDVPVLDSYRGAVEKHGGNYLE